MGLEVGTYVNDLNVSNPAGAADSKSQGDDHLRLIKNTLKNTFPLATGALKFASTDAGAGVAPIMTLHRDSASPLAADLIGAYDFSGEDSASVETLYARLQGRIDDPTNGSEDGALLIQLMVAGGLATVVSFTGTGINSTVIGGTTPAAGTFTALTTTGAFTSLGIDDNATGERLQLADTLLTLGTANAGYTIAKPDDLQFLLLAGGTNNSNGAALWLYGDAHATLANDIFLTTATGTTIYQWDHSIGSHLWNNVSGADTMGLNGNAALSLTGATPQINFTDTTTNADSAISANSAVGGILIQADINNEIVSSTIIFQIDGVTELTMSPASSTFGGSITSTTDIASGSNIFKGSTTGVFLQPGSTGNVVLRPVPGSSAQDTILNSSGNMTINGTLTVTG